MSPLVSRKGWLLIGIALLTAAAPLHAGESEAVGSCGVGSPIQSIMFGLDDPRATLNDALDQLSKNATI